MEFDQLPLRGTLSRDALVRDARYREIREILPINELCVIWIIRAGDSCLITHSQWHPNRREIRIEASL